MIDRLEVITNTDGSVWIGWNYTSDSQPEAFALNFLKLTNADGSMLHADPHSC